MILNEIDKRLEKLQEEHTKLWERSSKIMDEVKSLTEQRDGVLKTKSWKPKFGDTYYVVHSLNAESLKDEWTDHLIDEARWSIGNCFKTYEEAEFAIEKQKVFTELQRYADEHNECEIDWDDPDLEKHTIFYIYTERCLQVDRWFSCEYPMVVYFSSEKIAKDAIEEIGEERIKKYLFGVKG